VHLLLYEDEFGLGPDDPVVSRVYDWFLQTFDEQEGRWLWSEEGCIHAKSMIVFAQRGDLERLEKAWQWARNSPLYLPEENLFTAMRSGNIVQTLGPADHSLTGTLEWEHGGPHPDEENSAKFLYALLAAGRDPASPELRDLQQAVSNLIARHPVPLGRMNTHHLIGRAWYILCHTRFRLPPDDGYRLSLASMRAAAEGSWTHNFLMRAVPLARALMIRSLLEAGDRDATLDAMIHGFVASQDEDGAWRLPHTYALWGLDRPPESGYKYGNMDGANTYLTSLALISYDRWVSPR